jgi:hypothetical protein
MKTLLKKKSFRWTVPLLVQRIQKVAITDKTVFKSWYTHTNGLPKDAGENIFLQGHHTVYSSFWRPILYGTSSV